MFLPYVFILTVFFYSLFIVLIGKVEEKLVLQNTRNVLNQQDRKPSGMNQAEKNIETNSKENNFDNFTCKNCGRTYTRKGNLGRHLKYECQKVPQFPCGKCTKKFYRKEKLQYHVNTIHSNMMGTPLNLNVSATHLSENGSPNVNNESPINLSTHGIHMDLNIATAHLNSRLLTSSQAAGLPNVGLGGYTNPMYFF
jgi:Zinc finger, C2H2 type.